MTAFGCWRATTDGRFHYFVDERPLCGTRARPDRGKAPGLPHRESPGAGLNLETGASCRKCKAANEARWSAVSEH